MLTALLRERNTRRKSLALLREQNARRKRQIRNMLAECIRDEKTIAAYARQIRAAERKKLSGF